MGVRPQALLAALHRAVLAGDVEVDPPLDARVGGLRQALGLGAADAGAETAPGKRVQSSGVGVVDPLDGPCGRSSLGSSSGASRVPAISASRSVSIAGSNGRFCKSGNADRLLLAERDAVAESFDGAGVGLAELAFKPGGRFAPKITTDCPPRILVRSPGFICLSVMVVVLLAWEREVCSVDRSTRHRLCNLNATCVDDCVPRDYRRGRNYARLPAPIS